MPPGPGPGAADAQQAPLSLGRKPPALTQSCGSLGQKFEAGVATPSTTVPWDLSRPTSSQAPSRPTTRPGTRDGGQRGTGSRPISHEGPRVRRSSLVPPAGDDHRPSSAAQQRRSASTPNLAPDAGLGDLGKPRRPPSAVPLPGANIFGSGGNLWGADGSRKRRQNAAKLVARSESNPTLLSANSMSSTAPSTTSANLRARKLEDRISSLIHDSAEFNQAPGKDVVRTQSKNGHNATRVALAALGNTVTAMEAELMQMGKKFRVEDSSEADRRKAAERDEQRRKEQELARKMRDKAKQASNPKRRVELQLEQARVFGQPSDLKVPMQLLIDASGPSVVHNSLVDVLALQKKCVGIGAGGANVEKMTQAAAEAERKKKWEAHAFPNGPRADFLEFNCSPEMLFYSLPERKAKLAAEVEHHEVMKIEEAKRQRVKVAEEFAMRKVTAAKGRWPREDLCCSNAQAAAMKAFQEQQALEKLATVQMFSEETCITVRESRPSREEDQKEQLEKPVQKGPSKTARCWRLARALFFYACVLHSIRRRRRAGMIVDQIVRGIVRTKNLHQGCARLLRNVRTAQGLVRQLLARKQKFIDNATKMWVKWEDIHLQVCFNKDGAAKEGDTTPKTPVSPSSVGRTKSSKGRPSSGHIWTAAVDWRLMRIPPLVRKFHLGRWFFMRLRFSIQMQQGWADALDNATSTAKDMTSFYSSLGVEAPTEEEKKPLFEDPEDFKEKIPSNIFHVGEQEILELVAEAAKEIRGTTPFHAHPANVKVAEDKPHKKEGRTKRLLMRKQGQFAPAVQEGSLWFTLGRVEENSKGRALNSLGEDKTQHLEKDRKQLTGLEAALANFAIVRTEGEEDDDDANPLAPLAPAPSDERMLDAP